MFSSSRGQLIFAAAALISNLALSPALSPNTTAWTPLHKSQVVTGPATRETNPPEFLVIVDPSHGGDDRGMTFAGKIQEKDLTLSFGRELRRQLEERGIQARLLRESDVNLSLERRAETANSAHASIYIALHAGTPGKGARIYSAAVPVSTLVTTRPDFVSWESAQSVSLPRSRAMARAISDQLRKDGMPVSLLTAPLRPLNNLDMPAVAVEWIPQAQELKGSETSRAFARMAARIASAMADVHEATGAHP